jgi:hypothetical protein
MKTKSSFLMLFVLSTVFLTTTTHAQTSGNLSMNFQQVVGNDDPYMGTIEDERANRLKGTIPEGITEFHKGITREMITQSVMDSIARFQTKSFKQELVRINKRTGIFSPTRITPEVYQKDSQNIELSIKKGVFEFHGKPGKMSSVIWEGKNLAARSELVEHDAVRQIKCFYFDFGSYGVYPYKKVDCFNTLDEALLFAVVNNEAELVTVSSDKKGDPDDIDIEKIKAELAKGLAGNTYGQPINVNININKTGESHAEVTGGRNGRDGNDGRDGNRWSNRWNNESESNSRNQSPAPLETYSPRYAPLSAPNQAQQQQQQGSASSTQNTNNQQLACTGCESAWNRKDVAFMEQNTAQQTALQGQLVKNSRAQTGLQATMMTLQAGNIIVDQLERFGIIKLPGFGAGGGSLLTSGGPSRFPKWSIPLGGLR